MKHILRAGQWRMQRRAEQLMAVRSTQSGQRLLAGVADARRRLMDEPQSPAVMSLVAASNAQRRLEESARRLVVR